MSDKKEILAMKKHDDSRIFESLSVYPELVNAARQLRSMNMTNTNTCWLLKEVQKQKILAQEHLASQ